jgi:type I restriction enzyme S subunit
LEQCIAKKRLIKQGAMQDVLTPKESWEVKKLGEVFKLKQGVQCGVDKQFYNQKDGLIRFIRIVDVTQKEIEARFIIDPGAEHHIKKNDLFMVRYGAPGVVGFNYEGVIANNLFRLIEKFKINSKFFKHLFDYLKPKLEEISSSSTLAALNFTSLNSLKLSFPDVITEQTRIATILSDMDNEIESLENKLQKARQIKQGMMQELLTGRVRLV